MTTDSPTGSETLDESMVSLDHAERLIRQYGMAEAHREGIVKAGGELRDFVKALVQKHGQSLAELARLRAEVERLTAERDEASQSALDWCVGSLPACYNDLRDGTRAEVLSFALYLYARSLTGSIASEKQRAEAAEARAARLETALGVELDYWHERADEWETEGDGNEVTFAIQHALRIRRALNPEGGEHAEH